MVPLLLKVFQSTLLNQPFAAAPDCVMEPLSAFAASASVSGAVPEAEESPSEAVAAFPVIETVSVVTQVASFKLTGKRIFLMAPIHHHFEKKGWPEPRVIVRFWIVSVLLALVALSSLKLR